MNEKDLLDTEYKNIYDYIYIKFIVSFSIERL